MPKRSRHREAKKAGLVAPAPMKLATPASKPAPTGANTSGATQNAEPAKPAKKPRITTPPLTPDERRIKARLKRKRNEARLKLLRPEILAKLAEKWPAAFPADPARVRPLALGVHEEIEKAMPEYAKRALRVAVRKITNSEAYLAAVAAGGSRYDLDGNAKGEINEGAKKDALERLAAKRAKTSGTVK